MKIVHMILFAIDLLVSLAGILTAYFFYRHGSDFSMTAAVVLVYLAIRTMSTSLKALLDS